jgi:glycerol kinase
VRSVIVGLSQYADRRHLVRATLDGVCMQTKEARARACLAAPTQADMRRGPLLSQVIDAMNLDSGVPLTLLKVDGGLTKSAVCMQTQADVLGIAVGTHQARHE